MTTMFIEFLCNNMSNWFNHLLNCNTRNNHKIGLKPIRKKIWRVVLMWSVKICKPKKGIIPRKSELPVYVIVLVFSFKTKVLLGIYIRKISSSSVRLFLSEEGTLPQVVTLAEQASGFFSPQQNQLKMPKKKHQRFCHIEMYDQERYSLEGGT